MIKFTGESNNGPQILVIGIGGAALGVVDTISGWKLGGIETVFIDTKEIKKLDVFVNSLPRAEVTFTVTGLGGATGTVITPYLIDLLKKKTFWVWSLLTLPFFFEGKSKIINSLKSLSGITASADAVLVIPHDKVFKMVDKNIQMYKAFLAANDVCTKFISSIYRLAVPSGGVTVDFSEIKARLGHKKSTAFGTGSAAGPGMFRKAVDAAVAHPLLGKEVLSEARGLVVSILGGKGLRLNEVEKGIEFLHTFVPKGVNISFGVATDTLRNDKVQIGIIALGLDSSAHDVSNNWGLQQATARDTYTKEKTAVQPGPVNPPGRVKTAAWQAGRLARMSRLQQATIDFSPSFKGRFDKSKPTMYKGEDLDIPTFLRRKK